EFEAGERSLRRDLRVGYFEQEPALDLAKTVRDAVRSGWRERESVLAELQRVHAELDRVHAVPKGGGERVDGLLARQSRLDEELERLGGHDVEHEVEGLASHLGLQDTEARCGTLSGGERRRVALARI